ncbi:hypothetical protein NRY66_00985 [Acidithiobacillus ferrooxidans]|jgi:hypothetical protein|nr:hypothetical protein [Acidithiobacillus ferrooxidans]MCR1350643.1 hypothetical protein [Acidithiobacillus ferrooxidans]BDB14871.1 hypothetical protein ANFP_21910 [Acidithiobacillus ferrooxidans]
MAEKTVIILFWTVNNGAPPLYGTQSLRFWQWEFICPAEEDQW